MLNYLLVPLSPYLGFLRLFNYISFRAAGAAVTALLLSFLVGPVIIGALKRNRIAQVVRAGTPDSHAGKANTPTMGGLIILIAT
ncbi:MAG TPA: phospho-N-acetylmuramoyl-pentapeptide-transferase, partial [Gemmatimonadaceae bacterium]|nr:phospho-N-acetylmuramoyl-pentapeptide-transferase [Gemmatimonadaceae bacterium]